MSPRWMRMRGLLRKELLQIRRDPSSIALALVMPVVLLFVFGFGVSLDAENVPLAVVVDAPSPEAQELVARFALSRYFLTQRVASLAEAVERVRRREVEGIVHLEDDFARRLTRGGAPVQLLVNGVDSNRARLIQGYARGVLAGWADMRRARGEPAVTPPIRLQQRMWFNESARSTNFLVPGLVTLVMTLVGVLLTALVVAREWERGTMEAVLATPLRPGELLLGKLIPYYGLGMAGLALSVVLARVVFDVPLRGSVLALFATSSLFLLASLGLGLVISSTVRIQFVAAQISLVAGFLPAFFLSGLLFDLESTPPFVQFVSHAVPARYFVSISHTLFLAGDVWSVLLPNSLALGLMALLLLGVARRRMSLRLDG